MKQDALVKSLSSLAHRADIPPDAQTIIQTLLGNLTSPLKFDLWIYRVVVGVLGLTVLTTVVGGIWLAFKADPNIKLPDAIVAIGSAAVGALAGLLAPSPKGE